MRSALVCSIMLAFAAAYAAPRQHTVLLGRWRAVQVRSEAGVAQETRIRNLMVDGRLRESLTGSIHEVTERLFVVRRAFRMNDALPEEAGKSPQWVWRLGGWISVDRQTGHIAQLNLPAFDAEVSQASWYRDYSAYCGASDDGSRTYMMVAQLGKRKPILKKEVTGAACPAPHWERSPSRVTFNVAGEKTTFAVRASGADLQPEPDAQEEGPQ
jgi:hypothetical protein